MIETASALYAKAAKIVPTADATVESDSHCCMCGTLLPAGALANPLTKKTFNDAFNNRLDLRALSGKYVCGDCQSLWTKDWLQRYSKSFATSDNVYKFASNDQQAAFLLNPPEPPFAAIFSTRQQQHMIWRTPVSLSRELYTVRVDGDLLLIRQSVLMEGLRAYKHAMSVMANTPHPRTKRKLSGPAAIFDRELASSIMGSLRSDVIELLESNGDTWVIETLHAMSMGEWWALNVIRHYDPANPPAYVPVDFNDLGKSDDEDA
jgi:CRISPR type IV-associated protein Csf1